MFNGPGLYLMGEPEAALSFRSCLRLVALMHQLGEAGPRVIWTAPGILAAPVLGEDESRQGDEMSR